MKHIPKNRLTQYFDVQEARPPSLRQYPPASSPLDFDWSKDGQEKRARTARESEEQREHIRQCFRLLGIGFLAGSVFLGSTMWFVASGREESSQETIKNLREEFAEKIQENNLLRAELERESFRQDAFPPVSEPSQHFQ